MCGGTPPRPAVCHRVVGLSPRVRGNPTAGPVQPPRGGSIPACAGEPSLPNAAAPAFPVYPRVCGGTRAGRVRVGHRDGLSPRVRGNRSVYRASYLWSPVWGLSPRVRGNRPSAARAARRAGSIPACAGEPGQRGMVLGHHGVYPRVCGGTRRANRVRFQLCGLSPRVRGNPISPTPCRGWTRSIPACAGEPISAFAHPVNKGVYPRVCGGTTPVTFRGAVIRGLSPRVRGNL